jgi:hypothetical protein
MHVDPDFAKLIKIKANSEGMRYSEYTAEVAKNPRLLLTESDLEIRVSKKKRGASIGSFF